MRHEFSLFLGFEAAWKLVHCSYRTVEKERLLSISFTIFQYYHSISISFNHLDVDSDAFNWKRDEAYLV